MAKGAVLEWIAKLTTDKSVRGRVLPDLVMMRPPGVTQRGTFRGPIVGMDVAMFVGHLGVGLIGKRVEPRISLGTWMLAVLLADLVFFPLRSLESNSFIRPAPL